MSGNWAERPEWRAFLTAVVLNPEDDTPRLVAADWLDEIDDPIASGRAALIRRQVASRKPEWWSGPNGTFPEPGLSDLAGFEVDRGFPSSVRFFRWRFGAKLCRKLSFFPIRRCLLAAFVPIASGENASQWLVMGGGPEDKTGDGLISLERLMYGERVGEPDEDSAFAVEVRLGMDREGCLRRYYNGTSFLPKPIMNRLKMDAFNDLPSCFTAVWRATYLAMRKLQGNAAVGPAEPDPPDKRWLDAFFGMVTGGVRADPEIAPLVTADVAELIS